MITREKFGWAVALHDDTGTMTRREVWTYWSPDKEGIEEAIGATARAEAFMASGGKRQYHPVAVERIVADPVAA